MVNSKRKGNVGELAFLNALLTLLGRERKASDRRGNQATAWGGQDNSDVQIPEFSRVHWEVKNTKSFQFPAWVKQLRGDCPAHKVPVIVYREPGKADYFWLTLPFEKVEKFCVEVLSALGYEVEKKWGS